MRLSRLPILFGLMAVQRSAYSEGVCTPPPSKDLLPPCVEPSRLTRRGSVVSCYDSRLGFSIWSASYLSPGERQEYDRNTCDWKIDPNVKSISPNVYTNSGFVKGHLIAFTDVSCASSASETCTSSNIIPQPGVQNSGVWLGLEKFIRKKSLQAKDAHQLIIAGAVIPDKVSFIKPGLARPIGIWKAWINLEENHGCAYVGPYEKPYKISVVKLTDVGIRNVADYPDTECVYKPKD